MPPFMCRRMLHASFGELLLAPSVTPRFPLTIPPKLAARHGHVTRPKPGTGLDLLLIFCPTLTKQLVAHRIKIHFKDSKGELIKTIEGNEGDDILSLAHEHDIDLEGACEGSIACSTCHVILTPEHYDLLEEPGDDENDMLDMAFGLTDTSRLGCQVILDRKLDGMECTLPAATRNMFVDGEFTIPSQRSDRAFIDLLVSLR